MSKLNHRELMCVYFGFIANEKQISEKQKNEILVLTAKILGMKQDEFNDMSVQSLEGLQNVNTILEKMLKKTNNGENPYKIDGGEKDWR